MPAKRTEVSMNQIRSPRTALPVWLALTVVMAALIIGGFLLIRDIEAPDRGVVHTIDVTHAATTTATFKGTAPKTFVDPSPANFDKKVFNAAAPDAFRKTSENSWSVKGGRLFMQVHRNQAGTLVVRFVYPYEDFLPRDTVAMLSPPWIMTETYKLMDELQITSEQW